MTSTTPSRSRRMARPTPDGASAPTPVAKTPSRLDQIEAMLRTAEGASIAQIMDATGWQPHSVRGAMAGALKKRGLVIISDKIEGIRRYRVVTP